MKPEVIPLNELFAGAESMSRAPIGSGELVWDL